MGPALVEGVVDPELVEGVEAAAGPEPVEAALGPEPVEEAAGPEPVEGPVPKGMFVVYFLRLRSGVPYIGATADLEQRLGDHASGQAGRTTRLDPPISLLRFEAYPTFPAARRREAQLKRWSRAKKEALLRGDLVTLRALSQSREAGTPGAATALRAVVPGERSLEPSKPAPTDP
jgi:putative endonuclease